MDARMTEPEPTGGRDAGLSSLGGGRLGAARAACVALASVAATASVLSLPARFREYRSLTDYAPGVRDTVRANLAGLGVSVDFYAAYLLAFGFLLTLVCFVVGAAIFWRRSDEPMALFVAMLLVLLGATFSGSIGALGHLNPVWDWLNGILNAMSIAFMFLFFYLFPNGRFVPRWTRWLVVLILVYAAPTALFPDSPLSPEHWPALPYAALFATLLLTGIIAQVHRYRRVSSQAERQQTKWVVFGFTVALAGYLAVISIQLVFPSLEPGTLADFLGIAIALGCMMLIPLSVAFAVLRYRLYDIDVVVTRTLVYGILTAMLVAAYLGGVTVAQAALQAVTGRAEQSQLLVVGSTLTIAAIFQPLRNRIQFFIDSRFYRRKYDARKTLEEFAAKLRDETNLDALSEDLADVVRETVQPAHTSLWMRPEPGRIPEKGRCQVRSHPHYYTRPR
ncbi:hypothetical protein BH18ACT10_BH18ACT10_17020 [soil metagenome]